MDEDKWMTAGRLLDHVNGRDDGKPMLLRLESSQWCDMLLTVLVSPHMDVIRLGAPGAVERACKTLLRDPLWIANRQAIQIIDHDLDVMQHDQRTRVTLVYAWRALLAWMLGDQDRARICMVASMGGGVMETPALLVAWCLKRGVQPGGLEAEPLDLMITVDSPVLADEYQG